MDIHGLSTVLGDYVRDDHRNVLFHCPFCSSGKPKLSVNIHNGKYRCFLCESKGPSLSDLLNRLGHTQTVKRDSRFALSREVQSILFAKASGPEEAPFQSDPEFIVPLSPTSAAGRYVASRGFDPMWLRDLGFREGVIRHFGKYLRAVLCPLRDLQGDIVGWEARALTKKVYRGLGGVDKSKILFNYHDQPYTILNEGVFSALSWGPAGQALLGKSCSDAQLSILVELGYDAYYVALERDYFFNAIHLSERLHQRGCSVFVIVLPEDKDPNDLTTEERNVCMSEALTYSHEYQTQLELYKLCSDRDRYRYGKYLLHDYHYHPNQSR